MCGPGWVASPTLAPFFQSWLMLLAMLSLMEDELLLAAAWWTALCGGGDCWISGSCRHILICSRIGVLQLQ
jgi:hypothetical protein